MKKIELKHIISKRYGKLTVLKEIKTLGKRVFECRCDCGKVSNKYLFSLRNRDTKSCGCLLSEVTTLRSTKHGMTPSNKPLPLTYRVWASMIQRCENKNDKSYKYYGARGIKVSKNWHTFINFYNDMGEKPQGLSLDRKNNDGDYTKSNCRWATKIEQMNNTRRSKNI